MISYVLPANGTVLKLKEVWSGGQTGVDQAGLVAARELGFKTGGWMPEGWLTEAGPKPTFQKLYGMQEAESTHYPHRTFKNVRDTDATIWFGDISSTGGNLTLDAIHQYKKPLLLEVWKPGNTPYANPEVLVDFLKKHKVVRVNIAGNRESKAPGIFNCAYFFFVTSLKALVK